MQKTSVNDIKEAIQKITHYLEDNVHNVICWDGWRGLGASLVLREIAQNPPPAVAKKFDKIIHIDCSRWRSRRALQRALAEELKLSQELMAMFDRQDEQDDFNGLPESSREEIQGVGREILRALQGYTCCLVVLHNGSSNAIDLVDFGVPYPKAFGHKVLWTFRGRLRLNPERIRKVGDSHFYLDDGNIDIPSWRYVLWEETAGDFLELLLLAEATDVVQYIERRHGITPNIAAQCFLYLLALNPRSGHVNYNWAIHASNYWVCDGIIQGAMDNDEEAWDAATALQQELRLEGYTSNALPSFGHKLSTPPNRWVFSSNTAIVLPETTSYFLRSDPPSQSLPDDIFHQSDRLRVLKLCHCTFNFTSPPFHCCRMLRFLGLDHCKDQQQERKEKQKSIEMEFLGSLCVLDICYTDWELDQLVLSPEIMEKMARNFREVNINNGRIWTSNLAWRRLHNLRKLRVYDPTYPLETADMDEFANMQKLELLDLSRNSVMHVLPSLSGAIGLKTLVLDGCLGLQYVGPEGMPGTLESFSFDTGSKEDQDKTAKISRISLVGCTRLVNFRMRGSLPNLEELDISSTLVKTLDIKDEVVKVACLKKIILLGCEQLRSILWPEKGMPQLTVLCIDARGGEVRGISHNPLVKHVHEGYCHAFVAFKDIRFVQLLVLRSSKEFCWKTSRFHLYLDISCSINRDNGQRSNKDNKIGPNTTGQMIVLPQQKPSIPYPLKCTYSDVDVDMVISYHDDNSAPQFPALDSHMDIGEGINRTENLESTEAIKAIIFVMNEVKSLHVHHSSSITNVAECVMPAKGEEIGWRRLKQCRVESCPELSTVFTNNFKVTCFEELETFWAADLPKAISIWGKRIGIDAEDTGSLGFFTEVRSIDETVITRAGKRMLNSFVKLRSIHLHSCPRLAFVLPLSWDPEVTYLPNLETLHIVCCGDLRQVFPMDAAQKGKLEFPNLKHIYLHDLPSLRQICEAEMHAPKLERIRVRGCWGLRRLPTVGAGAHTIVDCEKDWWEKLEWDVSHNTTLFVPRLSEYYRKPLGRGSVLR